MRFCFAAQVIEWIYTMRSIPSRYLSGLNAGTGEVSSLSGELEGYNLGIEGRLWRTSML
jgi:hypothetical protein